MSGHSDSESERSYYRIPTVLRVRCRLINASEAIALEGEILTREHVDTSHIEPALCEWLDRVEDKLDQILSHFQSEETSWITADDPLQVTLSGAGLRVPLIEPVPVGKDVLVEMTLPTIPKYVARAIGSVARCTVEGKDVEVALSFRIISESDRAAVVAHVLEIQRSELRRRAEG